MLRQDADAGRHLEAALDLIGDTNRQYAFYTRFHLLAVVAGQAPGSARQQFETLESLVASELDVEQALLELARLYVDANTDAETVFRRIEAAPTHAQSADLRVAVQLTRRDMQATG